jgi:hypothetical protein
MANRIPNGATMVTNTGTGTTSATATLPAVANRVNYLTGLYVTSSGATAAATPTITVTNTVGGTLTFAYPQVAVATNNQCPLEITFNPAIPATASNTNMVAAITTGAGTTSTAVVLTGYVI